MIRTALSLEVSAYLRGEAGGSDVVSSEVSAPRRNVGGFIGHSWGVDKIDEVLMHRSGVFISPDFFPRTVSGVLSLGSEPGVVLQDLPVPLRVTRPFSRRSRTGVAILPQDSGSSGYFPAGV